MTPHLREQTAFLRWLSVALVLGWTNTSTPLFAQEEEQSISQPLLADDWSGRQPRWIGVYGSQIADLVPEDFRPIATSELADGLAALATPGAIRKSDGQAAANTIIARVQGQHLVSQNSQLIFPETKQDATAKDHAIRYDLGNCNLIFARSAGSDGQSSLFFDGYGRVQAMIRGSDPLEYGWSRRGDLTLRGRRWNLRLPLALQTRFFLATDGLVPQVVGGVIRPSPPPQIDAEEDEGQASSWFLIEPTSNQTVTILLPNQETPPTKTVVRGYRFQGGLDGGRLQWSARLTLDRIPLSQVSSIQWKDAAIIAVQQDGVDLVPENASIQSDGLVDFHDVETLDQESIVDNARATTMTLQFRGISANVLSRNGELSLPWPLLPGDDFVVPPQQWEMELELGAEYQLSGWNLPEQWKVQSRQAPSRVTAASSIDSDFLQYQSQKLILAGPPPLASGDPNDRVAEGWKVQLGREHSLKFALHHLRFEIDPAEISVRGKLEAELPDDQLLPITLELQDGFQLKNVTIGPNQREESSRPGGNRNRFFRVWPLADEIINQRVEIYFSATARADRFVKLQPVGKDARTAETRRRIESLWAVRIRNSPGRVVAAIIPPAQLQWTADSAIVPARIDFSDLTANERRFFAPLPGDSILVGNSITQTPVLQLEIPEGDLTVSSQTRIWAESKQEPVTVLQQETRFQFEGLSENLKSLRFQNAALQDGSQPPSMTWLFQQRPEDAPVTIEASVITSQLRGGALSEPETDASLITSQENDSDVPSNLDAYWEMSVPLPDSVTNQSMLICRQKIRSLPGQSLWQAALTRVAEASSQDATLAIANSLQLNHRPSSMNRTVEQIRGPNRSADPFLEQFQAYRYQPTPSSTVTVATRIAGADSTVVLKEELASMVSVSGNDEMTLRLLSRNHEVLRVEFPPYLHFVSATRDGKNAKIQNLPGQGLLIDAVEGVGVESESTGRWSLLEVRWVSKISPHRWFRWYRPPEIRTNALTLSRQYNIRSAPDTVLLNLPLIHDQPFLVSENFYLGFGWLTSLILLCVAWSLGKRLLRSVAVSILLVFMSIVIWSEYTVALTAFVALPLVLAGLCVTIARLQATNREQAMFGQRPELSSHHLPEANELSSQAANAADGQSEADFSSSAILSIGLVLALASSQMASAQEAMPAPLGTRDSASTPGMSGNTQSPPQRFESPSSNPGSSQPSPVNRASTGDEVPMRSVDVLVPLDREGIPLGNKVYIPESFYEHLLGQPKQTGLQEAPILSAAYHLNLQRGKRSASLDKGEQQTSWDATLEVSLRLQGDPNLERVLLPFRIANVVSVYAIDADRRGSIRLGIDGTAEGWAVLNLSEPFRGTRTSEIELEVVLECQVEETSTWYEVKTELPTIAASSLRLTTDQWISNAFLEWSDSHQAIEFTESRFTDTTRQSEDIPLNVEEPLYLRFQASDGDAEDTLLWERVDQWDVHYWTHIRAGQTVIECELRSKVPLPPEASIDLSFSVPSQSESIDFDPLMATTAWRQVSVTEFEGRKLHRFTAVASSDRPLRLMWDLATPKIGSWDIEIPRIRLHSHQGRSRQLGEAAIAWTIDSELEAVWQESTEQQPLPIDRFYAQWNGYLRAIGRATIGAINDIRVQRKIASVGDLETQCMVHVQPEGQRIQLIAEFTADDARVGSIAEKNASLRDESVYLIRFPKGVRILDWKIQQAGGPVRSPTDQSWPRQSNETSQDNTNTDKSVDSSNIPESNNAIGTDTGIERQEMPWALLQQAGKTSLVLRGSDLGFRLEVDALLASLRNNKPRGPVISQLGLISVEPADPGMPLEQRNLLVVTHSLESKLRWRKAPQAEPAPAESQDVAAMLADGRLLGGAWTTDRPIQSVFADATYQLQQPGTPLNVDTRITLDWNDGRWTAQTDLKIRSRRIPEYIDVAIPTRWCDSLQITPLGVSSRQPTLDPAVQVVRIQIDSQVENTKTETGNDNVSSEFQTRHLRLTSRLAAGQVNGVSVPEIRVLDAQRARIDVVVPTQLTNQSVRWRPTLVAPVSKPRWEIPDHTDQEGTRKTEDADAMRSNHRFFAVNGTGWSLDLETKRQSNRPVRWVHTDHRVFVNASHQSTQSDDQGITLVSRFDVLPGDATSVDLQIPLFAEIRSVRVDNQVADRRLLHFQSEADEPSSSKGTFAVWRVMLPWTRLCQSVTVTLSLSPAQRRLHLPTLKDLKQPPSTVDWCQTETGSNAMGAPQAAAGPERKLLPIANVDPQDVILSHEQRYLQLARSVVVSVATSTDALVDRRDTEIAAWLLPWVVRYRQLCRAAGRKIGQSQSEFRESSISENWNEQALSRRQELTWEQMDAFILQQETRYLPRDGLDTQRIEQADIDGGTEFSWAGYLLVQTPPSFESKWTFTWSKSSLPMTPLLKDRQPLSSSVQRDVMRWGFFVLLVGLMLMPMFTSESANDKQVEQQSSSRLEVLLAMPPFWMLLLGIVTIALAPLTLAFGLILTSLVLLVWHRPLDVDMFASPRGWLKTLTHYFTVIWYRLKRRSDSMTQVVWPFWWLLILVSSVSQGAAEESSIISEKHQVSTVANKLLCHDEWEVVCLLHEPLVIDPVSVAWGTDGSLWVVEMHDYPQPRPEQLGTTEPWKPSGRIRIFRDTDHDQRFDSAVTFADELLFVTGVLPYGDGAIVTVAGQILRLEDRDGDDVADSREVWFKGFSTGNEQLRANHPRLAPNGLVYVAGGLRGGQIEPVSQRFESRDQPISIAGSDFCFDPKGGHWGAAVGKSQFGLTIDDFGRRIGCSNRNPAMACDLSEEVIALNPWIHPADVIYDVASAGPNSHVMPISQAWTTSHLHAGQFSAACGVMGDGDNLFVCEPTGSLVQRMAVRLDETGKWIAKRVSHATEWLACSDDWFRPVDLAPAHGENILIVDMARAVIEHPDWAPLELKKRPDTYHGDDLGRIWLMRHSTTTSFKNDPIIEAIEDTNEALDWLNSSDALKRDLATRYLFGHHDGGQELIDELTSRLAEYLDRSDSSVAGRARAFGLLAGFQTLRLSHLKSVLAREENQAQHEDQLRETVLRLAINTLAKEDQLSLALSQIHSEAPRVKRAAAELLIVSLSQIDPSELEPIKKQQVLSELETLIESVGKVAYLSETLGALGPQWLPVLIEQVSTDADDRSEVVLAWWRSLTFHQPLLATRLLLTLYDLNGSSQQAGLPINRLVAWREGLQRARVTYPGFVDAEQADRARLEALAAEILQAALKENSNDSDRLKLIDLCQFMGGQSQSFRELFVAENTPLSIRARLIAWSLRDDADWARRNLEGSLQELHPAIRDAVVQAVHRDSNTASWLIQMVDDARWPRGLIPARTADFLRKHRNPTISARAAKVFAAPKDREKVLKEYQVAADHFEQGDVSHGKTLFAKHCSACHRMEGVGHEVGPDISDSRTKTPLSLLTAILAPSLAIDASYQTMQCVTVDGEAISGVLVAHTDDSVTLRLPEAKLQRIPTDEIEQLSTPGVSLMPDGFEQLVSIAEMTDLLAYLKRWRYE